MNKLGWNSMDTAPKVEAVNAAAADFAKKYPKNAGEIEQARMGLEDSINHPPKFA